MLTGGRGIWPTPRRGLMSRWPPNWNGRPAGRKRAGGLAAAAAFLERAAALTPDPARRAARALAAARPRSRRARSARRGACWTWPRPGRSDEPQRARAELLRARLTFGTNRGNDAPPLLLKAARRLEPIDVGLARGTYLDALTAAMFAGRLASPGGSTLEVAGAARGRATAAGPAAPARSAPGRPGRATSPRGTRRPCRCCGRRWPPSIGHAHRRGAALAVAGLRRGQASVGRRPVGLFSRRHLQLAREAAPSASCPVASACAPTLLLFAGELAAAAALIDETRRRSKSHRRPAWPYGALQPGRVPRQPGHRGRPHCADHGGRHPAR